MASLTARKLDPSEKESLRRRAARHGHSMEEEVRRILGEVCVPDAEPTNAFDRLRRHFRHVDRVELELPMRRPGRAYDTGSLGIV